MDVVMTRRLRTHTYTYTLLSCLALMYVVYVRVPHTGDVYSTHAGHHRIRYDLRHFLTEVTTKKNFALRILRKKDFIPQIPKKGNFIPQVVKKGNFLPQNTGNDDFIPQIPRRNNSRIIIVWSQIRSGSSFTTAILESIPNSYTSTEPVRTKLNFQFPSNESETFLANYLTRTIHCDIDLHRNIDDKVNRDFCFLPDEELTCDSPELGSYMCRRSSVHLLKIVVLEMKFALEFIRKHPHMDTQIIHLVRDPRGTVASARSIVLDEFLYDVDFYCNRLRGDLETGDILQAEFPGRYMRVRYEDLALHPITWSRKIYGFLKVPFTVDIYTHVMRLTSTLSPPSNIDVFSVEKMSVVRPLHWRHVLPYEQVLDMQATCSDVLRRLRYRVFADAAQYGNESVVGLL